MVTAFYPTIPSITVKFQSIVSTLPIVNLYGDFDG